MSRDGSGGYQLPEPPFVFDTIIDETAMNNNLADLGNEMANSIAADGQTTPTANLKMGGRRHINVGNAVDRTDYPAVGQIQDGGFVYAGLATGTANAIVLTLSPNITALVEGMEVLFKAASTNTGAATIKIGGATAVAAEVDGAAMVGGEIVADKFHRATYDGTALQVTRLSMPEVDTSPTTTQGDMIRRGASEDERLALGTAGLPLVAGATVPDYAELGTAGLADNAVTADKLASNAVDTAAIQDGAVTDVKLAVSDGIAKAWVNFTGTGTVTINGSYNVASVTDRGVGDYTVNWDTDFADANYSAGGQAQSHAAGNFIVVCQAFNIAATTGAYPIQCRRDGGNSQDPPLVYIQAWGNQ